MKHYQFVFLSLYLLLNLHICIASATDDLKNADDQDQIAFVLITEPGAGDMDKAHSLISNAVSQVPNSVSIEINRSDPQNRDLVNKFRVKSAPMPLILVIDRNGTVAGGNKVNRLSIKRLVAMVPTPKKSEVLSAVQDGKAVLLSIENDERAPGETMSNMCSRACALRPGELVTIQVDINDEKEKSFLKQLKVDTEKGDPVTVVFNKKGKITGTFENIEDINTLVQAATKVSSGCSGGKCGKGGCKKPPTQNANK